MTKRRSGFTIVELIIVIVVIGILAAIAIIAYNGTQRQAQSAQIAAAAKEWEKLIKNYSLSKNGNLSALVTSAGCQPYLGRAATEFTDTGGCTATFNQTIVDTLKQANGGSEVPAGRLPSFGTSYQGIRYIGNTLPKELQFVQSGNGCPAGVSFSAGTDYTAATNTSVCHIYIDE